MFSVTEVMAFVVVFVSFTTIPRQITADIRQGNVTSAALFSEWMTAIPAEHVRHFIEVIDRFQHLAVITYTPVGRSFLVGILICK